VKKVKMVIISDVHLRSEACQARLLLALLEGYDYEKLLIVGDLIEDDRTGAENVKMRWQQFQVIEYLRQMQRKKHAAKEIVRVGGNHDPTGKDLINEVLGVKTIEEYRWEMNGRKYCAIHGHQFDRFLFRNPFLNRFISSKLLLLQRFDTRGRLFSRWVDRFHNRWLRLGAVVAEGAKRFASRENLDVVICGHVHESFRPPANEIGKPGEYWNCGDWTGKNCALMTVDLDGSLELIEVDAASSQDAPPLELVTQPG